MGALRPTIQPPLARAWRAPGGPWDLPPLDGVLPGGEVVDERWGRLSAAAVDEHIAVLAGGLRARGVRRRDVVAWQLPNGVDALLLYRACWRLGAVAAPVHHAAGAADVDAVLTTLEPSIVLRSEEEVASVLHAGAPPVTIDQGAARPSDLAAVLFTAGSTGAPKGVLHTHRTLGYKTRLMVGCHALTADDVVLMPAPLAHVSGLLNGVLVSGGAGMRSVLMRKWEPERALDLIEAEGVTFMIGPPTFFVSLMGAPGFRSERVASLRLVSSGGAGVTPAFVAAASETLGCTVKRTYGSTEAPSITTTCAGQPADRAGDTDGRPIGAAEVRLSPTGELLVRGPEVCVGYLDAAHTREAFARGGWFRTGDLAAIDDDGWLRIVGRVKDVIIRGGENIAAAEVEAVLEAHPAVVQAVAVGMPDDRLGERVAAFVVATQPFDLEACRRWFESRGVTRFKTPERVEQVAELPLLAAGKPDRAALRRRLV